VIKEVRWPGWVWAGECFFWYRPTRVVPDKRPLNGCCCCCCWCYCCTYVLLCFTMFCQITETSRWRQLMKISGVKHTVWTVPKLSSALYCKLFTIASVYLTCWTQHRRHLVYALYSSGATYKLTHTSVQRQIGHTQHLSIPHCRVLTIYITKSIFVTLGFS